MTNDANHTRDWWDGRRQGLADAAEMLRKCGDRHCQDMAGRIEWLATLASGLGIPMPSPTTLPSLQGIK